MRGRGKWSVVWLAVLAMPAVAGCAQTVDGTAQPARSDGVDIDRSYGYADNRCGLLQDSTVQEVLGADKVVRPYSGAVCQYVLSRHGAMLDVVFAWFDTGNLERERAVAVERGAEVTDTEVGRHPAFLARRDTTGVGCAATAAAAGGVLSWWVQVRGEFGGQTGPADPCPDAEKLLSATLKSDM